MDTTANLAENLSKSEAVVNADGFNSTMDFFMLGGLTIVAFCVLQFLDSTGLSKEVSIAAYYSHFAVLFPTLELFVNYPHAMFSYRFAYQQGGRFIFAHRFILIWLPILLAVFLFMSIPLWNAGMQQFPAVLAVDSALQRVGIYMNAPLYRGMGQFMLACLLMLQTVALGWHYVMQAFGVSLACAHSQRYPISEKQKEYLRYHLLSLWIVYALSGYMFFTAVTSSHFEYFTPRFPDYLKYPAYLSFLVTGALVWQKVVWHNWKTHGRWPPVNSITTIVAIWLWMQPFWYPFGYQLWIVPFGHGLQYLAFAYRVERNNFSALAVQDKPVEKRSQKRSPLRFVPLILLIFLFGFLGFEGVPRWFDNARTFPFLTASFFVISAGLFINIHHYWIDSVVWRSRDSKVRSLLAKPADQIG